MCDADLNDEISKVLSLAKIAAEQGKFDVALDFAKIATQLRGKALKSQEDIKKEEIQKERESAYLQHTSQINWQENSANLELARINGWWAHQSACLNHHAMVSIAHMNYQAQVGQLRHDAPTIDGRPPAQMLPSK